jgi:hypothetical protein
MDVMKKGRKSVVLVGNETPAGRLYTDPAGLAQTTFVKITYTVMGGGGGTSSEIGCSGLNALYDFLLFPRPVGLV